jgi:hypothetical protein
MNIYIYTLSDPQTGEIRYIGQTSNPKNRIKSHLQENSFSRKSNWVRSLKLKGLIVIMDIIDICDELLWEELEIYYISLFKCCGFNLTNHSTGGVGNVFYASNYIGSIDVRSRKMWEHYHGTIDTIYQELLYQEFLDKKRKTKRINKRVIAYDIQGIFPDIEFPSIIKAAKCLKIRPQKISDILNHNGVKRKSKHGIRYVYKKTIHGYSFKWA